MERASERAGEEGDKKRWGGRFQYMLHLYAMEKMHSTLRRAGQAFLEESYKATQNTANRKAMPPSNLLCYAFMKILLNREKF